MPAKRARTATRATRVAWRDVRPGDIFFTKGGGIPGALIRRGTESPYGHCGVIARTRDPGLKWHVHEAFPSFPPWRPGLESADRAVDTIAAIVRVWRTETERKAIIGMSNRLVSQKLPYAWSEIGAIAAATILPHSWIPTADASRALICSNHVAQCIRHARPEDYERYFRYPPNLMWPGGLHYDLQAMLWNDHNEGPIERVGRGVGDAFRNAMRDASRAVQAAQNFNPDIVGRAFGIPAITEQEFPKPHTDEEPKP